MDPYALFNMDPSGGFTAQELKTKCRDLLSMFKDNKHMQDVTKHCYTKLLASVKSAPQHPPSKKFDINKFNDVFEKQKISDVYDTSGYDDWIQQNQGCTGHGAIVHTKEPEPLIMPTTGLGGTSFYELGADNIDDFSGNTESSLNFMDYRIAHSTSKLVDEDYIKMPTYNSIEDIKAERSQLSYDLSLEDRQRIEREEMLREKFEQQRAMNIRRMDSIYEKQHHKVNKIMLGTM